MTDIVLNVVLGLVASAISATLGWLAQTLRRRRRLERTRAFFGMPAGTECLVVVNRSTGMGSNSRTVTRRDAYALMELAGLVRECGARADVVAHDAVEQGLGAKTELCFGGPVSNERMAAHLAWGLPGVEVATGELAEQNSIMVGGQTFTRAADAAHYVLVARLAAADGGRPVFLICGQTGIANQAGVRYLTTRHQEWARRYGVDGTFAVVLKVINPKAYGPDVVELAADVTRQATTAPVAA